MKHPGHSSIATAAAIVYLLAAGLLFGAHLVSVKTNPADSGESAIPFFLLTLPWLLAVPEALLHSTIWAWMAYPVAWLAVGFNAALIYAGIRLSVAVCRSLIQRFRNRA